MICAPVALVGFMPLLGGVARLNYSEVKWLTNFSGADRNGEWLVCIEMTFWHGVAVYIFFCKVVVTPLSWSV